MTQTTLTGSAQTGRSLTACLAVTSAPAAAVVLVAVSMRQWQAVGRDTAAHGGALLDAAGLSSWIAVLITTVGALCAVWLSVATLPLALLEQGRLHGRGARAAARSAPRLWRGLVATAVGVGATLGATGAAAYEPTTLDGAPAWGAPPSPSEAPAEVAPAHATPEIVETPLVTDTHEASPLAETSPQPQAELHRVRRGDSLWDIAASRLPHGASHARITAAWRAIYQQNRSLIGSDPGLIHPGQVLVIPKGLES